ncbi:phage tail tape measure protein [Siphonobacter sp. SORGH_AS_0500]|uniref:phage tail tape measure protein n=1 Tax=Siphonobacter sp. SORGH_AS_0500 TaxID=1864824 RepID=UPI0028678E5C|nr:phage tail tape measure protein [Siphonobacter sp. SORGH_AS_0500]MDR6195164.1 TP901 family phage tail tape measure protein [Siphonobacter sp. SORGH_AS_0500]
MNTTETSRVKVVIDGQEGEQTLKSLQAEAKEINAELRRMRDAGEVGSEAWKELKNRQADVNAEMKSFKHNIDINDASMAELTAKSRLLQNELKDLKTGSQEWIDKMDEIAKVDAKMVEVRDEMSRLKKEAQENSEAYQELQRRQAEVNEQMTAMVRNIDLNDASMNQLQAKSKLLNDELKDLKVGSEAWLQKMEELGQVDGKIADLGQEMARVKKETLEGSDAYQEMQRRQHEVNEQMTAMVRNIDLNDASMNQLQAKSKLLNDELKDLKVGSEAWLQKMEELGQVDGKIADLGQEMARVKKETLEGSDAYQEMQRRQHEVNEQMTAMVRNIDLNDASMNQLQAKSKLLNDELKELKVGSEAWINKMKEIDEVDRRIEDVGDEMNELRDRNDDNALSWKRVKEAAIGTFAAFSLEDIIQEVISFGKEAVNSAAEMSDAMSDIEKATDMTSKEVEGLVDNIKKIDTRTAVEDLNDIAVVAGQLGIAKNEVLGFVESVDRAVVALGDEFTGGAEEVAATIGGLQKLFKETKDLEAGKAINDIGSALNALGAAGSATAPVVADFTSRMGQLGDLSPQIGETMGLGAAFQELGLTAEIAAGGLSNILLTAAKDTDVFAKHLGMTEAEFKKLINSSPNDMILKLAASFKGMPVDEVTKRLSGLGIKSQEATKVMSLLKDQTDQVAKYQKLAADEMKKGTSLTDEFNKKNTNAAAELAKMGKEVKNMSVSFGQALLPVVLKVGQALIAFVNTITSIPKFLNDNKAALALLTVGLVTFNAQAISAAAASLAVAAAEKGRAIATSAMTVAQNALNVAMKANPIGLVISAIAALAAGLIYLYDHSQTVRASVSGLWNALQVGLGVLKDFWNALKNMNFAEAANIWSSGGTKVAQAFGDGYKNKIKSEQAAIEGDHKAHVDKKVNASKKGADDAAGHQKTANKGALDAMSGDNATFQVKEEKKAADHAKKVADEHRKANESALKAIEDMKVKAIANDLQREIAQADLKYKREIEEVRKSVASTKVKKEQIELLEAEHLSVVAKLKADAQAKQDQMTERWLEDEFVKKVKKAQLFANDEIRIARETITDKEKLAQVEAQIHKWLNDEISAIRKDKDEKDSESRSKNEKEESAQRLRKIKAEKNLFDTQFEEASANADLNLKLAKNNADAIYQAKLDKLKAEKEYHTQKLKKEAEEEKERNKTAIQDKDERADAEQAIDSNLKTQLKAADEKFEADKTQLGKEHIQKRKENMEGYFNALEALAKGDYNSFMNFLGEKLKNDAAANNKKLQDFTQKGQETLQVANQVIGGLKQANQKYLESQLAKIEKEKASQIKSWDAQYKAGKINKEDYEKKIAEINANADEKVKAEKLKAFKREQTLNIASALVNAAQAALKSMAMMGFPLGLIGVAASAAMAAIQIGIIKSQKPPAYAKGGTNYVKNAGVVRGSRHGSQYGQAGISMVDRVSGQEVGEMEGDEPFMILSRDTYKNNGGIIDMLLHSSLHRNGARIFRDGGVGTIPETPYSQKGSYLFGSKKAKKAAREAEEQAAAAQAEAEEQQRQAEADANAAMSGYGGVPADGVNVPGSDGDASGYVGSTNEQIQASQEMMSTIAENTDATVNVLNQVLDVLTGTQAEGKRQTGFLGVIASKDLSVSVHNVVNVMNQINVVAGDSNLK